MMLAPASLIARMDWRKLAVGAAAVVAVVAVEAFLHDPFGWRAAKAARLQAEAARASEAARARAIEAEGERQSGQRVTVLFKTAEAAQAATTELAEAAQAAPDAKLLLDPTRVARIRANDQALCELDRLSGCPGEAP